MKLLLSVMRHHRKMFNIEEKEIVIIESTNVLNTVLVENKLALS